MFPARINDRIRNDVAAECEQNNEACQQTESRYLEQTHYSDLLMSLAGSVKRRRLFIEGKLTQQQWLATLLSASLHLPHRHNFCAFLRNRPPLADAPIHRVDVDDHRLFEARHVVPGDCANARWRASVFSLPHRQQRENCRKEIRPAAANAETRSHLYKTCDQPRLALHFFRLRE